MEIPGRQITLVIDVRPDGAGHWIGSAIVPGFDVKGAPLTKLSVTGSSIQFTIQDVLGEPTVTAEIRNGVMKGNFSAAGNSAPFALRQVGPTQVDLPLRNTMVQPELEGEWHANAAYMGSSLDVKLSLRNGTDGASATFSVTKSKESSFPVNLVRQEGSSLMLEIGGGQLGLEAEFDRNSDEIRGTVRIGGVESPIVFRRGGAK